ncbi:MAG: GMC family oxidoreductase N-terminal domain-containing protein [Dehalococcoidales bacterium]|nr:GMC family oxidoreductase N-terminal domain-containing protein [Dehalococcoidales bacterium]
MKKAIVVGSGAGGATAAKELQGEFEVTVLEAGNTFHPFTANLAAIERLKKTGLLFNERLIQAIFPAMRISKAANGMVLVKGEGFGGTTTLSAGNALRMDGDLKEIGIDLDAEFKEIYQEIPVSSNHEKSWHKTTRQSYEACRDMGLNPVVTPKMIDAAKCIGCGKCVLGCSRGAKWDSRRYLDEAALKGAHLIPNCHVQRIVIEKGRATGVIAGRGWRQRFYAADLVVLAAGGLGSPVILENSGIKCDENLFIDPVLCVAAKMEGCRQAGEIPMPFVAQREHFIISPYFDFLSFYFNRDWHYPAGNIYSLMIKLADTNTGGIHRKGVKKYLSDTDRQRLDEGTEICKQIFERLGVRKADTFMGTINAGHPGGMLPLTEKEAQSLHDTRLPRNLFVADATLFPHSLGNPPILTIIALAKRISKKCLEHC